jgi:hypothetical protein
LGLTTQDIRVALQISLLGEVYADVRAVAYSYDSNRKFFLIRFYLNRTPTEDDYENVSIVMTEFISHFKHSEFDEIKEECLYSNLPKSALDALDGFVYSRKE